MHMSTNEAFQRNCAADFLFPEEFSRKNGYETDDNNAASLDSELSAHEQLSPPNHIREENGQVFLLFPHIVLCLFATFIL